MEGLLMFMDQQKETYSLNIIFIKIPMLFFMEIKKAILKFIWMCKRTQAAKAILSKKSNVGGITSNLLVIVLNTP
jgi:hypothetical protein